ncbi:MAG: PAS domain S-box protein, partial [Gammaproteobacteria bacterium]|nr:PAS domain S-box protein [Gammaproteobacteria bacterium]
MSLNIDPLRIRPFSIKHLLLLVLVILLLSFFTTSPVLKKQDQDIDFLQQEGDALTLIDNLYHNIDLIQRCRGLRQRRIGGTEIEPGLCHALFKTLNSRLEEDIETFPPPLATEIAAIRDELIRLYHEEDNYFSPLQQFVRYSSAIEKIVDLIRTMADRGNLSLDAEIDGNYLAQILVRSLPDLSENIGTIRELLSYGTLGDEELITVKPLLMHEFKSFEKNAEVLQRSLQVLSQNNTRAILPLTTAFQQWLDNSRDYIVTAGAIATIARTTPDRDQLFAQGTVVLDQLETSRKNLITKLRERIQLRQQDLNQQQSLFVLTTLIGLIFLFTVLWMLYNHVNRIFATLTTTYRQLKINEIKQYSIFKSVMDGIVIIDNKGIIVDANPAVTNLFGFNRSEMLDRNISMLMPSPEREAHDSYLQRYQATGKSSIIGVGREVMGQRKDKSLFPINLSVEKFTSAGETYFTGVIRDITAQKEAVEEIIAAHNELERRVEERTEELIETNQELHELIVERSKSNDQLRLFAKVFENAGEAIIITDTAERIIDVNATFSKITGFTREEAIGERPSRFSSGRHDHHFYEEMWQTISTEGSWQGEIWDRKKNGMIYPKRLSINVVRNHNNSVTHYVGIFSDITSLKQTEEKLHHLAYNDPLTELNNRTMFQVLLSNTFEVAVRDGSRFALLFIDLDQFKMVNDTLGHSMGDLLLIEISQRIKKCLRKSDSVARIGGDEFTVILPHISDPELIATVATKIISEVSLPVILADEEATVGASIGISIYPNDGTDIETLSKHA